jgi:hypothetical protein
MNRHTVNHSNLYGELTEALHEQVADLFWEIIQISHRQQYFYCSMYV